MRKILPNIFNSAPNLANGHPFTPFLFHVSSAICTESRKESYEHGEKKELCEKDNYFLILASTEQIL